jgi:hypothetical protein
MRGRFASLSNSNRGFGGLLGALSCSRPRWPTRQPNFVFAAATQGASRSMSALDNAR